MAIAIRVGAIALVAIFAATAAQADDGYICDGGKLLDAQPATLEKLNNTDPCSAGFVPKAVTTNAKPPVAHLAPPPAPTKPSPEKYRNAAAWPDTRGPAGRTDAAGGSGRVIKSSGWAESAR